MLGSTSLLDPSVWWHHVSMLNPSTLAVNSCGFPSEIKSSPAVSLFPKKTLGIYWSMQQKLAEIRWLPKDMTVPTVPTQTLCNSQSSNLGVSWSCFSFKPGNGSTRVLAPKLGIFPRKSVDPHGFHCGQIGWFPIPKGPVFHQKCTMLMLEKIRPTTWDV